MQFLQYNLSTIRPGLSIFAGVCLCLTLLACNPNFEYTEALDFTLDGSGVATIDAVTSNGEIRIVGTDGDEILVHAEKRIRAFTESQAADYARNVEVFAVRDGDTLRVFKEHPKFTKGVQVMVRYEIQAPRSVSVRFKTSNGKIVIERVEGAIEARTSNGGIHLTGGNGQIDLVTSNGRIEIDGANGKIDARTSNGAIAYAGAATSIKLSSSNGKISATLTERVNEGRFGTSNGSIDVAVPSDFNGEVDAHTSNGSVRCDFPITIAPGGFPRRRSWARSARELAAVFPLRPPTGAFI